MTQTQSPPRRLVQHIRLKAPVARVYKALTDADELKKWFPIQATSDARVGGGWRFEFQKAGGLFVAEGRYLELVPDRLVRYSWQAPLDDAGTALSNLTVLFKLEPDGDETDVYLEETGYGEGDLYDKLFGDRSHGWGFFMQNLASLLAGGADLREPGKAPCDD